MPTCTCLLHFDIRQTVRLKQVTAAVFECVSAQCNMNDGNTINNCVTGSFSMLQLSLQLYSIRLYKRIACDAKLFLALDTFTATYSYMLGKLLETEQYELRNRRTVVGAWWLAWDGSGVGGCMTCFAALSSI